MPTRPFGTRAEASGPGEAAGENQQPHDGPGNAEPEQPAASEPVGGAADAPAQDAGGPGPIDPATVSAQAKQRVTAEERKRIKTRKYQREWNRKHKAAERAAAKAAGKEPGPGATRKSAAQATLDLNNILFSVHLMVASLMKMPSLILTEEEAKRLAAAITRVSELYDVPILDEKTRAWLNLSMVGFEVYGTRIITEMTERRKKHPAPPPMVITPVRPHSDPPPPPQTINGEGIFDADSFNNVGQA
jgi:hypothetical protein